MRYPQIFHRPWSRAEGGSRSYLLKREWLVTNGLGGYASGTLAGVCTRRYHGLLIAALPAPLGRMLLFNHIVEEVRLPDRSLVTLSGLVEPGEDTMAPEPLSSFTLEFGLPVWHYQFGDYTLERRVLLPHESNTVHLTYRLIAGPRPLRLRLTPGIHFRPHESAVSSTSDRAYAVHAHGERFEIVTPDLPPLRMRLSEQPGALVLSGGKHYQIEYPLERERGYPHTDVLWSPGHFTAQLSEGEQVTLTASTESWDAMVAVPPGEALSAELIRRERLLELAPPPARCGTMAELVLAADQFIITPTTRVADAARAHAAGDEVRSIIAGYHWFTDWGRDTMISLEGLTLSTGRWAEAGYILRTFAHYVRDGLIPNLFPEGEQGGLYHTADATLWYFHALDRYVRTTGDRTTLRLLLPMLRSIVQHHVRGTHFGIGVDPSDGLLRQGQAEYQLTWMDAKVGDWVVTPRRGKAVEINALWYNALQLLGTWLVEEGEESDACQLFEYAERVQQVFNKRFWCPEKQGLYDVIDTEGPDDSACRPNQIFAISLAHPVLHRDRWPVVLETVCQRLVTPMGLRSLAPGEPNYQPKYDGDLRARDAAYHQGTVWAWLMGPFIDAWLKVHPGRLDEAREFLAGFTAHLGEDCIGSISEIFDAEAPYAPRGCIAQAWSVAEILRSLLNTAAPEEIG